MYSAPEVLGVVLHRNFDSMLRSSSTSNANESITIMDMRGLTDVEPALAIMSSALMHLSCLFLDLTHTNTSRTFGFVLEPHTWTLSDCF